VHRLEIPDPCLVVLIGAAGAGKSTFAARHFRANEVLSSDAYRRMLTGDEADQRASGLAFRRLHEELGRRLASGRLTVVDATNVTPHARKVLLGRARDARVPAIAIVLDPPAATVHAQNAGRTARVVPSDVVDRHLAGLRVTVDPGRLEAEGFAVIHHIDGSIAPDEIRVVRRPA
jgi:protein phosphatase